MLRFITLLIFVFLALLGLSDAIFFSVALILKPKKKPKRLLYVLLDSENAESQILSEVFNLRWFGEKIADKIVFLTNNLDKKEKQKFGKEFSSEFIEFKDGVLNGRE